MALTTSLHTALTGLSTSSRMLNVAGDNISNVNTHGYKRSRISFQTSLTTTLRSAAAPTGSSGGRNPIQVGHGAEAGAATRDFSNGSLQPTGVNTDMAIEGNGFFIVDDNGTQQYTRAGNFDLDSNFNLVTSSGAQVQGFGVDANNQVVEGVLQNINIPIGNRTVAEATGEVQLGGNLNAGGDAATTGSTNTSIQLYSDALATTNAVAGDNLNTIYNGAGTNLFNTGDVITLQDVTKGGTELPAKTFEINGANTTGSDDFGTTVQDFMDFLENTLGINTTAGGSVGITGGQIQINGNEGTVNDIDMDEGDLIVNKGGGSPTLPLDWTNTEADGESVRTTFAAYDSLGNEMQMSLSMSLDDKNNNGTTWRYFVESDDGATLDRQLATGTIDFDNSGQLLTGTNPSFTIDLSGTGAETPQQIELELSPPNGTLSALSDQDSNLVTLNQDGSAIGTLEDFTVSQDGTINGVYSNSLVRTIGQIALADFTNPEGLEEVGSNMYAETTNSGAAQVSNPGQGALGRVVGSALEQSNVDLSQEFIDMIAATTSFSANSRVMSTSDRLIQELINTIR